MLKYGTCVKILLFLYIGSFLVSWALVQYLKSQEITDPYLKLWVQYAWIMILLDLVLVFPQFLTFHMYVAKFKQIYCKQIVYTPQELQQEWERAQAINEDEED